MLNGATLRAAAIAGTAVFKIVVSSDSMKNATATSHGSNRLLDAFTATAFSKPYSRTPLEIQNYSRTFCGARLQACRVDIRVDVDCFRYRTGTSSTASQY